VWRLEKFSKMSASPSNADGAMQWQTQHEQTILTGRNVLPGKPASRQPPLGRMPVFLPKRDGQPARTNFSF
jgi:hypothetical protein